MAGIEFLLVTIVNDGQGRWIEAVVDTRRGLEHAIGAAVRRIHQRVDTSLFIGTRDEEGATNLLMHLRANEKRSDVVVEYFRQPKGTAAAMMAMGGR